MSTADLGKEGARARTLRTVADLATLTDIELDDCLAALRAAIGRCRQSEIGTGGAAAGGWLFDAFAWTRPAETVSITLSTPVACLPIHSAAKAPLIALGVATLGDLTQVSESDVRICKHVGKKTFETLRQLLAAHGLAFRDASSEPPSGALRTHPRRRSARGALAMARRALPEDAPLADLLLPRRTLRKAHVAGLKTLGDLRSTALPVLCNVFGTAALRRVVEALDDTGTGLVPRPTERDLWRAGLIDIDALPRPEDGGAPVEDLRPWVGAAVDRLQRAGLPTLSAVENVARSGRLTSVPGMTAHAVELVQTFFRDQWISQSKSAGYARPLAGSSVFAYCAPTGARAAGL